MSFQWNTKERQINIHKQSLSNTQKNKHNSVQINTCSHLKALQHEE